MILKLIGFVLATLVGSLIGYTFGTFFSVVFPTAHIALGVVGALLGAAWYAWYMVSSA